jgi:hypothetical protein
LLVGTVPGVKSSFHCLSPFLITGKPPIGVLQFALDALGDVEKKLNWNGLFTPQTASSLSYLRNYQGWLRKLKLKGQSIRVLFRSGKCQGPMQGPRMTVDAGMCRTE